MACPLPGGAAGSIRQSENGTLPLLFHNSNNAFSCLRFLPLLPDNPAPGSGYGTLARHG
jgi:hypothetical protein